LNDRPWRDLTPERIRAARASLGLSQADFALLIGRTEGRGIAPDWTKVSRWERGVRNPGALWGPSILAIVEREENRVAKSLQKERPDRSVHPES
jgi:DNA-binding transcriptional regulator YiaG